MNKGTDVNTRHEGQHKQQQTTAAFCEEGLEWVALLGGASLQKDFFPSIRIVKVSGTSVRLTQE